ncbi:unnamed protein product [Hyaloperonospora brassicae]|uniref:SCP2 domain-containing protein n=1 Tax=Hyaloperonospora brassicae TaxID=162125 RepID=A0AAV0UZM5_HYABA|nr:unnamed protein product [Hyaloperonospora brassicae]
MEFLKFSVKPRTSFHGTIVFQFKTADDAEPTTTYAVEIDDEQHVVTRKNVDASDVRATCDVKISMDDFLYVYSGKASSSDLLKLFYAGRVAISGYAFRSVSKFAQSFDFSSEKWCSFYAWQKARDEKTRDSRALGIGEERSIVDAPSRDDWYLHAKTMLDSFNLSRLQRLLWETSLTHLFGEKIVLDSVRRASVRDRKIAAGRYSAAASVMGDAGCVSAVLKRRAIGAITAGQLPYGRDQRAVLARFLHPCRKQSAVVAKSLALGNPEQTASAMFNFVNEDYVGDVQRYAKQRQQRRHYRNRVDLGDAGMAQLDKLVQVIGKGGHSNAKRDNRSKYVPAPERLLREFRVNVASLMDTVKEKASGRKALCKIPAPEMNWLVRNGRSGSMVIADSSSGSTGKGMSAKPFAAMSPLPNLPQTFVVEVNRAKLARNRKRFDVPKQRIRAKFASISRELVNPTNPVATPFDEHLVFSDYL